MTLNEATLRAAVDAYAATPSGTPEREAAWEALIDLQSQMVAAFVIGELIDGRLLRGPYYYGSEPPHHAREH